MPAIKITPIDTLENDSHPKAGPRVAYNEALNLFMLTSGRQIVTVRLASPKDMQHLVTKALASLKNPAECRRQLKGLDYRDPIDKWFAVDTLRTFKAKVAAFGSEEEALKAL